MEKASSKSPNRHVYLNDRSANAKFLYSGNVTRTAKYTPLSFLPKNLFEQFRRVANIYFLKISILQMSTNLSPTHKFATAVPLVCVLFANMVKEAYEDWKRHQSDRTVNHRRCRVLQDGKFVEVLWKDVVVGDICEIYDREEAPADIVVLSSSEASGNFYVETANLDGENNLKVCQIVSADGIRVGKTSQSLTGFIEYELPNNLLYEFKGRLLNGERQVPISIKNLILRGMVLRNTQVVYGIVIYTGPDTKLSRNSQAAPSKRSNLEKNVNTALIFIFTCLVLLSLISTLAHAKSHEASKRENDYKKWYLDVVGEEDDFEKAASFITFIILFNNLVPISLYISMEFVRLYQARLIESDIEMYYEPLDIAALARTSNLNEELGQVEYIFSDKTGTLTCNEMELRKCSIAGNSYFVGNTKQGIRPSPSFTSSKKSTLVEVTEIFEEEETSLMNALETSNSHLHEFMMCMIVCHMVIPEHDVKRSTADDAGTNSANAFDYSQINYQAQSPDEVALVSAARQLGYTVVSRNLKILTVHYEGKVEHVEILNVNEFTSSRKRMSVICRRQDGRILLYCKGADSVMLQRVQKGSPFYQETSRHVNQYATEGLRTLILAKAHLNHERYAKWNDSFTEAAASLDNRDALLAEVADEIERDMHILGASAIEDKLQQGVTDALQTLSAAGIKIWVLTGDKQETAINIAYSTQLISKDMHVVLLNYSTMEDLMSGLQHAFHESFPLVQTENRSVAAIVDGSTLELITSSQEARYSFMEVAKICSSVIACRVSPSQKAEVVRMVKDMIKPQPITLAIGDGANDVSMIQEANVGIGLSGKEGMQAVQSSDYAISQFRFLSRLLLVHGRWDYARMCKLILYSFYKNMAFVFTLFYFTFQNSFSGTTLYESWLGAGWNVGWTLLPVIFLSILDQDVSLKCERFFPCLYRYGQTKMGFNAWTFFQWSANACVHAFIVYYFGTSVYQNISSESGHSDGLFTMGTAINCAIMLSVNLKISLETNYWTHLNGLVMSASISLWFIFVLAYSYMLQFSPDFYSIGTELLSKKLFWISLPLIPSACLVYDLFWKTLRKLYFPTPLDIVQEIQSGYSSTSPVFAFRSKSIVVIGREKEGNKGIKNPFRGLLKPLSDITTEMKLTTKLKSSSFRTQMDTVTLEFTSDKDLEAQFGDYYYMVSSTQTRLSILVLFLIMLITSTVLKTDATENDNQYVIILILSGSSFIVAVSISPIFKRIYQPFIFATLLVSSIVKTLTITTSGIMSTTSFSIVAFIVFRLRFKYALRVAVFDVVFYLIYVMAYIEVGASTGVMNALILLCIFTLGAYSGYKNEIMIRRDFLLQRELQHEREQVKNILENMLPPHITKRMEDGEKNIADSEGEVSVLFCDVQEFNKLVFELKPREFVTLLDSIYSRFDKLSSKWNVRKMETVGPTYMACAGLEGSSKHHALATCQLAFDMLREITLFETSQGEPVKIRIGINSGKVISGVVGEKKPQYCLFGDTVNTASRMQSTGVISCVQVSKATFELVKEFYDGEPRTVAVKGKGTMDTYILSPKQTPIPPLHTEMVRLRNKSLAQTALVPGQDTHKDSSPFNKGKILEQLSRLSLMREQVPMNLFSLKFINNHELETEYQRDTSTVSTQQIRVCLAVLFLGILSAYALQVLIKGRFQLEEFFIRLSTLVVVYITQRFSNTRAFSRNPEAYACLIYIAVGILIMTNYFIEKESMREVSSAIIVTYIYLIFNIGGLSFMAATFTGTIVSLNFIIIGAIYHGNEEEENSSNFFSIFVVLAVIVDMISARTKELYMRRNFSLMSSIKTETKKIDSLLQNMLPSQVIADLKSGQSSIADVHSNVAILFSDIVGFTDKASRSEPVRVIELLSRMFSIFDALTEKHGVYKVETIGDAYVVVAGLPTSSHSSSEIVKRTPAERLALFARDMQQSLADVRTFDGEPVKIRIGLHYGRILAGVIGRTIYRYDIWGGDVLIAATMESRSEPGRIHVTPSFKSQVDDICTFEDRGEMVLSNGTKMCTYFVSGFKCD